MGFISDDVLRRLRAQLDAREAQLRDEVRRLAGEEFDPRDGVPMDYIEDAGEQAEQRTRRAVRRAEQERDIGELRAITGAKERMAHGTYGQCVDCGTDIPMGGPLYPLPATVRTHTPGSTAEDLLTSALGR